jgi:hypothetical protein
MSDFIFENFVVVPIVLVNPSVSAETIAIVRIIFYLVVAVLVFWAVTFFQVAKN